MLERIYALSDLHGHLSCLEAALEVIDLAGDPSAQLILLGDYLDRGPHSAQVLYTIRDVQRRFTSRVIVLPGNHEDWFLDWLDADDADCTWLMADPSLVTIKSFLDPAQLAHALGHDDPDSDASSLDGEAMNARIKSAITENHGALIAWLRNLPRFHETEDQIFVHAGIDEQAGDLWRAATPDYMFTEKYPASLGDFSKTIIAGHVGTDQLHDDGSHTTFFDGASHYYIDGSVEITGKVNVLRYNVPTSSYDAIVVDGRP